MATDAFKICFNRQFKSDLPFPFYICFEFQNIENVKSKKKNFFFVTAFCKILFLQRSYYDLVTICESQNRKIKYIYKRLRRIVPD